MGGLGNLVFNARHIMESNADNTVVRRLKHRVRKGETSMLSAEEMHELRMIAPPFPAWSQSRTVFALITANIFKHVVFPQAVRDKPAIWLSDPLSCI
jgi:hypothetical protein